MLNKDESQGHLLKESWIYPSSPACLRLPSETCHSDFPRPLLAPVAARLTPPLKPHHPASRSATHYRRDDCGRGLRIHILLSDKPRLSQESHSPGSAPSIIGSSRPLQWSAGSHSEPRWSLGHPSQWEVVQAWDLLQTSFNVALRWVPVQL